jgi:hypothetical protein
MWRKAANMNAILQTPQQLLLSVTAGELTGICNALNEVCHGVHIGEPEFETRLGVSRSFLADLLAQLGAGVKHLASRTHTRVAAWADGASVQVMCISVSGDPADLGSDEARAFVEQLREAIADADA